jgi:hypothetical protein
MVQILRPWQTKSESTVLETGLALQPELSCLDRIEAFCVCVVTVVAAAAAAAY